jgi:hypothetical protein
MLMRTPFAPAASNASINTGSREAGPIVARILAFLTMTPLSTTQKEKGKQEQG